MSNLHRLQDYEFYVGDNNRAPVKEYIDRLEAEGQARFYRKFNLLLEQGSGLPAPHSKPVRGKIHELRVQWNKRSYRVFYFIDGKTAILLHVIVKAREKLQQSDICIAEKRMSMYLARKQR